MSQFYPAILSRSKVFLIGLLFISSGLNLQAQNKVTGIAIDANQTGTVIYGASTSATYNITLSTNGDGNPGTTDLSLNWVGAAPVGVSYSFNPASSLIIPASSLSQTITLTITSATNTGAGNYNFTVTSTNESYTSSSATFEVGKKALSITATGTNKIYDGNTNATVSLSDDRISGDVMTTSYTTATFTDKNVGPGKIVSVSGISLGGADAGNYTFNTTTNTTSDITAKVLVITATGINKVYDGNTTATVYLSDDRTTGDVLTTSYTTATFANKNIGNGKTVSVSGISISGADAGNYTFNTTTNTTADITAKVLTITASAANKVYDGNTTATISLSDDRTSGDVITASYSTATFANKNIGNGKTVSVSGISISGADAGNYTFNTTSSTTGNITSAALTITATGQTKTYGVAGNLGSTAFTSSGLQNGEIIGSITLSSTGTPANSAVDTYPIVPSNPTGTGGFLASNYTITFVNGTLTVGKAALTISATGQTKIYGVAGNLGSTAFTSSGLQNSETIGGVTLSSTGTPANAAAGTYPIVPSAATGGTFSAANYTITYTNGSLTVGKALLTITATAQNKVYGAVGNLGSTAFTAVGLQNSETIGSVTLTSTGTPANAAAGTYPIVPSAAIGGTFTAANYTISYATTGNLSVGKAPLTITATAQSKAYGVVGALGNTAFISSGLQIGQTIGSVTLTSTGTPANSAVGTYSIVPSAATGGTFNSANYSLTYTNGTLTVTKSTPALTLSSNNNPACFGADITFTATITPAGTATGTVTFYRNGAAISGAMTVTGNAATFTTNSILSGNITASYSGDGNYNSASSNTVAQTVTTGSTWTGATSTNWFTASN